MNSKVISGLCRAVLDSLDEGLFVFAVEEGGFRCVYANEGILLPLGFSQDAVVGHFPRNYFSPDQAALTEANLQRAVEAGGPIKYRRTVEGPASTRTFEITAQPLWVDGAVPTSVLLISKDVSSQRLAEEVIASVAHKLRTPLTSLVGFADLLGTQTAEVTASERAEMLATIVHEGLELSNTLDDLVVAARLNLGDLVLQSVSVDIAHQVAQVLLQQPGAVGERIATVGTAAPALADPLRVRQVVRGLLANAIQHGGFQISIELAQRPGFIELTVIDNGDGIPPSDSGRMFSPFFRTPTEEGGLRPLGIGLPICRYLARHMGGDLIYERRDDRTRFCLTLPAATDATG